MSQPSERDSALRLVKREPHDAVDDAIATALRVPLGPEVDFVARVESAVAGSRPQRTRLIAVIAVVAAAFAVGGGAGAALVASQRGGRAHAGPPVVLLMDTPAPRAVYDAGTAARGGTNADDLSDLLRDLPVALSKESLSASWNRETEIMKLHPDLVLVHRSAFFHAMNLELKLGYPPFADPADDERWHSLYRAADDKLIALLGLLAVSDAGTKFIVYSRGTGGGWPEADYRKRWADDAEKRFPALRGRIQTVMITGGVDTGTFKNDVVSDDMRSRVKAALGLENQPSGPAR